VQQVGQGRVDFTEPFQHIRPGLAGSLLPGRHDLGIDLVHGFIETADTNRVQACKFCPDERPATPWLALAPSANW